MMVAPERLGSAQGGGIDRTASARQPLAGSTPQWPSSALLSERCALDQPIEADIELTYAVTGEKSVVRWASPFPASQIASAGPRCYHHLTRFLASRILATWGTDISASVGASALSSAQQQQQPQQQQSSSAAPGHWKCTGSSISAGTARERSSTWSWNAGPLADSSDSFLVTPEGLLFEEVFSPTSFALPQELVFFVFPRAYPAQLAAAHAGGGTGDHAGTPRPYGHSDYAAPPRASASALTRGSLAIGISKTAGGLTAEEEYNLAAVDELPDNSAFDFCRQNVAEARVLVEDARSFKSSLSTIRSRAARQNDAFAALCAMSALQKERCAKWTEKLHTAASKCDGEWSTLRERIVAALEGLRDATLDRGLLQPGEEHLHTLADCVASEEVIVFTDACVHDRDAIMRTLEDILEGFCDIQTRLGHSVDAQSAFR
eukprot:GHVU01023058.1.p1 GENE.GHVU01023058.1~~GHVU01023058.1.p1  ORF type:complete len:433 (+),score=52.69 GHVU01023058.1:520-1818(+)